jgi:hypothetical protein
MYSIFHKVQASEDSKFQQALEKITKFILQIL